MQSQIGITSNIDPTFMHMEIHDSLTSLLRRKLLSRENITSNIWKQYVNCQLSKFNHLNVNRFVRIQQVHEMQ